MLNASATHLGVTEASVAYTDGLINGTDSYGGEMRQFLQKEMKNLKYVTLVFYLITFVFGLVGNILVLYVITYFTNVRRKSVANYYIWNLALADVLFILTLPFFCYATFTSDWVFGDAVCKISHVMRECNKFASVFTLVALSFDRYLATHQTIGYLRTVRAGKIICLCIWIVCSIIVVPFWIFAKTVPNQGRTSCHIVWPMDRYPGSRAVWTYFQLTAGFLVPFVVIAASYIMLVVRMARIMKCRTSRIKKPNRKLTKTILVVVITFLVCQAPYQAVEVISLKKAQRISQARGEGIALKPSAMERVVFMYLNFVAIILVFVSSCCNPILYGVLNENYRKLYQLVLCRCRRVDNSEPQSFADEAPYESTKLRIQFMFHAPCIKGRKRKRGHQRIRDEKSREMTTEDMTMTTVA